MSCRSTGCSGATRSSSSLVNPRGSSVNCSSDQPPNTAIHSPDRDCAALARIISSACRCEVTPSRRTSRSQYSAARMKCVWLSMRPGITVLPCKSILRVSGPVSRMMSRVLPTATSRSPFTASASATEKRSSTVTTLPWVRIRSAGVVCPWAAPIQETSSQQSVSMQQFIVLRGRLLERAHTHRIGPVALGHIALGDHLCFHCGIARIAVV